MSDKKSENLNELEMKDEPKAVSNEEPKVDPETELKEVKYKKKHYSVKDRLHEAAFLSPSLLGVLTFFVIPFFVVIYYANIDSIIQKSFFCNGGATCYCSFTNYGTYSRAEYTYEESVQNLLPEPTHGSCCISRSDLAGSVRLPWYGK